MLYRIIESGSSGNCELVNDCILIDCGVSFKKISQYAQSIKAVLLTHQHSDHFNLSTLQALQASNSEIKIISPVYMLTLLKDLKNIVPIHPKEWLHFEGFSVASVVLYHDVKNVGYRIKTNYLGKEVRIFRATDTAHLQGIRARAYDVYAIEHNYCEIKAEQEKQESQREKRFTRIYNSEATHLSKQQAQRFLRANARPDSIVFELHKSQEFY